MPPKDWKSKGQLEAALRLIYEQWLQEIENDIDTPLHYNWIEGYSSMLSENFVITLN